MFYSVFDIYREVTDRMSKFLLASFLFVSLSAQPNIGGYIKTFGYLNPNQTEYTRLGTRFQTRFSQDNGHIGFKAALNFESEFARSKNDSTDQASKQDEINITPIEFYIDLHFATTDLRIGQQFIFWGATDWVNPTDVINPWDYEHMSGEIEDYRLPVFAASFHKYFDQYTLQLVAVPVFQPNVIPLPDGTDISLPELNPGDPQWGLRLQRFVGETDLSLSYFSGYSHSPTLRFESMDFSGPSPLPEFSGSYSRNRMVGMDFVRTMNAFALKGETAWIQTPDQKGTDIFETNPYIQSVLGVDYAASEDFTFNLQYINHTLLNYSNSKEQELIDNAHMTNYMTPDNKVVHSMSSRIAWNPAAYWSVQILGETHVKEKDYFLLGFVNWEPRDATSVTIGTVIFGGKSGTEFGQLNSEDQIFLELKQSF